MILVLMLQNVIITTFVIALELEMQSMNFVENITYQLTF